MDLLDALLSANQEVANLIHMFIILLVEATFIKSFAKFLQVFFSNNTC